MKQPLLRGRITSVDHAALTAVVRGEDGREYSFTDAEWDGSGEPIVGIDVLYRLDKGKIDLIGLPPESWKRHVRRLGEWIISFLHLLFGLSGRISRVQLSVALFAVWFPLLAFSFALPEMIYPMQIEALRHVQTRNGIPDPEQIPPILMQSFLLISLTLLIWICSMITLAIRRWRDLGWHWGWLPAPLLLVALAQAISTAAGDIAALIYVVGLAAVLLFWPGHKNGESNKK